MKILSTISVLLATEAIASYSNKFFTNKPDLISKITQFLSPGWNNRYPMFLLSEAETSENQRHHMDLIQSIGNIVNVMHIQALIYTSNITKQLKQKYCAFIVDGKVSLKKVIKKLDSDTFDYNAGSFIFMLTKDNDASIPQMFFDEMFHRRIFHVYLLTLNVTQNAFEIFYYDPYTENRCNQVTIMSITHSFQTGQPTSTIKEFDDRSHRHTANFFKCNITIATFDIFYMMQLHQHSNGSYTVDGFEGNILNELAKKLNFTIDIVKLLDWGTAIERESGVEYTGALKLLDEVKCNASVGGFIVHLHYGNNFELSQGYSTATARFVTGPGRMYTPVERLLLPFHQNVWIALITTFSILSLLGLAFKRFGIPFVSILDLMKIFLGLELTRLPKCPSSKSLTVLLMLTFVSVRHIYTGCMYSTLSTSRNMTLPKTIKGMIEMGYTFHYDSRTKLFLSNIPGINSKPFPVGTKATEFFDMEKKIALMVIDKYTQRVWPELPMHPEEVYRSQFCFLFPKNSHLRIVFNRELQRFTEAGLIAKWERVLDKQKELPVTTQPEIKTADIYEFFLIFGTGCAISTVVFVIECIVGRCPWNRLVRMRLHGSNF